MSRKVAPMKHHQDVFGGQGRSKLGGRKTKYMKHKFGKWNPDNTFSSQKPYFKPPDPQDQIYFRSGNKKPHIFPQKIWTEASPLCAPHAPRNTTSYIMRAKNSGGIPLDINTPSPSTPSNPPSTVLVTPRYDEGEVEQVNHEWGVDSYGSMKGLLSVRHTNLQNSDFEPDFEKCLEILHEKLEQRFDQDLSRFEIVYPFKNEFGPQILETRINDQDNQIAFLEEESTNLKERLHCMENQLHTFKRRMRVLEGANALRPREICSGEVSFA